jgi:hypothetical protein
MNCRGRRGSPPGLRYLGSGLSRSAVILRRGWNGTSVGARWVFGDVSLGVADCRRSVSIPKRQRTSPVRRRRSVNDGALPAHWSSPRRQAWLKDMRPGPSKSSLCSAVETRLPARRSLCRRVTHRVSKGVAVHRMRVRSLLAIDRDTRVAAPTGAVALHRRRSSRSRFPGLPGPDAKAKYTPHLRIGALSRAHCRRLSPRRGAG